MECNQRISCECNVINENDEDDNNDEIKKIKILFNFRKRFSWVWI